MNKAFSFFIVFFVFVTRLFSQVAPSDGAKLHYRIIGFTFPGTDKARSYKLEVASGKHATEAGFNNALVITRESKTNKIIAEVPAFGASYTWRVVSETGSGIKRSPFYHFETLMNPMVDTNLHRIRITKEAQSYKDGFVFMDCTKSLYDMKGNPVWFIPDTLCPEAGLGAVVDLKLTDDGTLSYIFNGMLFEITYEGKLLASIPDQKVNIMHIPNNFHHAQQKLHSGHYMVLGNESFYLKRPNIKDSIASTQEDTARVYQNPQFGRVEEYDEKGKLIWSWNSSKYFLESDLINMRANENEYNANLHMNSFFYDEMDKVIYVGFKNISRIVKIKYPEGTVISKYGKDCEYGKIPNTYFFCDQHSCRKSKDGLLYVFNNNACSEPAFPKLEILKEPNTDDKDLKLVWEYECPVVIRQLPGVRQGTTNARVGKAMNARGNRGGNMIDLPNGDVFASLNAIYNSIFIISRNKEILWNGAPERWDTSASRWIELPTYRASIIADRKGFEQFLWKK